MKKFEDIEYLAIEVNKSNYIDIFNYLISLNYILFDYGGKDDFIKYLLENFKKYKNVYIYICVGGDGIGLYTGLFDDKTDIEIDIKDVKYRIDSINRKEQFRDVIEKHLLIENLGL